MSSISSAAGASAPSLSGASQSGLRAELAQLKKEQSACVNCASAETQAGKLNIQKLATEIGRVETRLSQHVQEPRAATPSDAPLSTTGRLDLYA